MYILGQVKALLPVHTMPNSLKLNPPTDIFNLFLAYRISEYGLKNRQDIKLSHSRLSADCVIFLLIISLHIHVQSNLCP